MRDVGGSWHEYFSTVIFSIACLYLLIQFHEERNEWTLLVFFLLLVQRLIEQSMIEEQSIDKFIAKDYFFSLSRVEQFCILRFEFDFDITMEH